ncbi:GNAT family N-acetyltransferase [Brevibacterium sp.]|uniref:GNAT family N-acetyltransferase n=1 Tax=Brevibacterium sp. TaxID=1701 RepID=UPI002648B262|nr:GNAT family N-acetyltransferase [Brevibacterium sp.]MDN5832677.1 GNAT family N-acetyltransferase [Brevibacterium sp.]MDN6132734.1 GNAT family N-acetyltransferase [Brevibacterium sp.]MDN6156988.1 GNAT family N-acetyltransferase [Brevibacterium sp.]MDN6187711.1 GNAT family N-acetyltransferase [Brevibacterium sp.]MDN6604625.1 GNAT family N-acetyltransferase [Brevibacterium sp.]
MEITHIPAGSRTSDAMDEILAEVVAFDTIINEASGLGVDFDPRSEEVRQELMSDNDYVTHQTWIGRLDGAIVAKGIAYLRLQDNLDLADVWCSVHPRVRRQGVGTELLAAMEASLAGQVRTQLTSYCEIPAAALDADLRRPHLAAESGEGRRPSTGSSRSPSCTSGCRRTPPAPKNSVRRRSGVPRGYAPLMRGGRKAGRW